MLSLAALLSEGAPLPFADEDKSGEAAVLVCLVGASLSYMSIGTGVIVAVALKKVDRAPDAKTGTESHNESLQYTDCCVKKCHTFSSFARFRSFIYG